MRKPESFPVYDINPVIDWISNEYDLDVGIVNEFRDFCEEIAGTLPVVYLSTEDVVDNFMVRYVLNEFGTVRFINRGGQEIKEIHLML